MEHEEEGQCRKEAVRKAHKVVNCEDRSQARETAERRICEIADGGIHLVGVGYKDNCEEAIDNVGDCVNVSHQEVEGVVERPSHLSLLRRVHVQGGHSIVKSR